MINPNFWTDDLWCVLPTKVYKSEYQLALEMTLQAFLGRIPWKKIKDYLKAVVELIQCTPFPFQSEKRNEWFFPRLTRRRRQAVQVINVTRIKEGGKPRRGESYLSLHGFHNFQSLSGDGYELFFHGTSHMSAADIVNHGIDLNRGGRKKDFNDGGGFYLCNDFIEASSETWAGNRPRCSAVLVFQVLSNELRPGPGPGRGLNLQGANERERWKEVVRRFRRGLPSRPFLEELGSVHFIEGPMAGEGQNFQRPIPNEGSYQLCIRNKDCAELFDQSLHSVVFFEPER